MFNTLFSMICLYFFFLVDVHRAYDSLHFWPHTLLHSERRTSSLNIGHSESTSPMVTLFQLDVDCSVKGLSVIHSFGASIVGRSLHRSFFPYVVSCCVVLFSLVCSLTIPSCLPLGCQPSCICVPSVLCEAFEVQCQWQEACAPSSV